MVTCAINVVEAILNQALLILVLEAHMEDMSF